nr:hypothetical protein BHI3_07530 [Bacteriovorax sp. HI3]
MGMPDMKWKQFSEPEDLVGFINANKKKINIHTILNATLDGRIIFTLIYI